MVHELRSNLNVIPPKSLTLQKYERSKDVRSRCLVLLFPLTYGVAQTIHIKRHLFNDQTKETFLLRLQKIVHLKTNKPFFFNDVIVFLSDVLYIKMMIQVRLCI
jgi:hypothetical protein